jgi:hypothetical protein
VVVAPAVQTPHIVRYLTSDGPADADADSIGNASDTCPGRFGPGPTGCPAREPSTLTIGYAKRVDDFQGILSFGPLTPCIDQAIVVVYRKRHGPDRRIGRSAPVSGEDLPYPAPAGERLWGVSSLPRPGRYYAVVQRRVLPDFGICESGRSAAMRIRRHLAG